MSELDNDSGYITSEAIPSVPTKTSELQNDSDFVKVVVSDEPPAEGTPDDVLTAILDGEPSGDYEEVSYTGESGLTYDYMNLYVRNGLLFANGSISGQFQANSVTNIFKLNGYKAKFDFRSFYGASGTQDGTNLCPMAVLKGSNQIYIFNTLTGATVFKFNAIIPVEKDA